MTAYNVVRFKVKPGKDKEMMDYWRTSARAARARASGARDQDRRPAPTASSANGIRWTRSSPPAPEMIANPRPRSAPCSRTSAAASGVTDPVSGEVVLSLD